MLATTIFAVEVCHAAVALPQPWAHFEMQSTSIAQVVKNFSSQGRLCPCRCRLQERLSISAQHAQAAALAQLRAALTAQCKIACAEGDERLEAGPAAEELADGALCLLARLAGRPGGGGAAAAPDLAASQVAASRPGGSLCKLKVEEAVRKMM